MTDADGAAPKKKGAARGRAASSELVKIYEILHKAGKPLTVPEIAELMPKTGYMSAALNAWREHNEARARAGDVAAKAWLETMPDRPGPAMQKAAMIWWVRKTVSTGRMNKYFVNTSSNPKNTRVEGVYLPGKVPYVSRKVWEERTTLVEWSAELSEQLNRGHAAGIEFTAKLNDYRLHAKRIPAEIKELLDLAERAIRPHQGA